MEQQEGLWDPKGCNLHFFLLLWVHLCVVVYSVGITELTQVVGSLVS